MRTLEQPLRTTPTAAPALVRPEPWPLARRQRQWPIQTVVVIALLLGGVYLVWRPLVTMGGVPLWLTGLLYASELVAWLSLAGFAFVAWDVRPPRRPPLLSCPSVDVLVPTYNEGDEVLRPTLIGCLGLDYPDVRIHLLDDGRRAWVEALAAELGVGYRTRIGNAHAKAGNINAALPDLTGDLVLILDADHVPQPDMLTATVGYFEDPKVAFVQTPHEFYNTDSVQHMARDEHDQSLFYRVIQPGRDHHGAAFWCGSGAVIRRSALDEVGGLATETITEDFHTSLRMHIAGWESRYHNEPLVFGIAPHNIAQFLLQRDRWASGNLAAFRTSESPLTARGLGVRRRICYLVGLGEVLSAPQRIITVAVVAYTVTTGTLPLAAPMQQFVPIFLCWAVSSVAAATLLSRGRLHLLKAVRFEYFTLPSHLRGIVSLVRPETRFKVTPKDGVDRGGLSWVRYNLALTGLIALLAAALAWRGAAMAGLVPAHHLRPGVLAVVLVLALFELSRLVEAALALSRRRQLRTAYRFPTALPARLNGRACTVEDLSVGGCALRISGPVEFRSSVDLEIDLGALGRHRYVLTDLRLTGTRGDGSHRIQGPIFPLDDPARNALAAALFVLAPTLDRLGPEETADERAHGLAGRLRPLAELESDIVGAASGNRELRPEGLVA